MKANEGMTARCGVTTANPKEGSNLWLGLWLPIAGCLGLIYLALGWKEFVPAAMVAISLIPLLASRRLKPCD